MLRRGLVFTLGSALLLSLPACFEEIDEPDAGTTEAEGSAEAGTTPTGSTTGTGTTGTSTTVDPDSGSDDGVEQCAPAEICVDLAPAGWDGPVAYFEGDDLAALPSCAAPFGGLAIEVFDELFAPPALCDDCSCGAAQDIECTPPSVRFYSSSGCDNGALSEFQLDAADDCTVFPGSQGAYGAEADPVSPIAGTGACAPSGGEASIIDANWDVQLRACAPPALEQSCGEGRACAPTPGEPFAPGLCIHRPGDVACPAGDYSERFLRYQDYQDARGCDPCECGSPAGGVCNAQIVFSYTNSCTADYLTLVNPGSGGCTTLWGDPPSSGVFEVVGVMGAACEAIGGVSQGLADPIEPVTFCCTG